MYFLKIRQIIFFPFQRTFLIFRDFWLADSAESPKFLKIHQKEIGNQNYDLTSVF